MKLMARRALQLSLHIAEWAGWELCPECHGNPVFDVGQGRFLCSVCNGDAWVAPEEEGNEASRQRGNEPNVGDMPLPVAQPGMVSPIEK